MYIEYKGKFYRPLHPRPTVVLGTLCKNGRVNLMPASWNTPVSEEPPTVAIAVDKTTYTYECLEYHGEATINVASDTQIQLVYDLGSVSGRSVDKVEKFSVELVPSVKIKPPGLQGSLAILEGRVMSRYPVGEVMLYIFEILLVRVLEGIADEWGLDLSKANLLLHSAGRVFYRVAPTKLFARKRV
ncbi:flavin reductase [Desulfurococcaceae archaeon AG1]|jgi:flavin reductase (DIM6/NTAB) family NADH-FMN oxidoreductase RutF|nr:MAG: flavin reductase family protein [Desulfurococcaceae archaeon]GAY26049.1 flavin reductase [Desulfurococcaceae archaeon AG1]